MLNLKKSNLKALKYFNKIKSKIKNFEDLNLSESDIKNIIISEPENLLSLNEQLMKKVITGFSLDEFIDYINLKNNKQYCLKYHSKILKIKKVFNYKNIIGNDYFLANLLEQQTCLYCNRNYTKTIGNSTNKIIRAEYDHFFSQSKYPLLVLSFYNLLPVCSYCNKKKTNKDFQFNTHLNPYLMDQDDKSFQFSYRKINITENNVKINILTSNNISENRIKNTFSDLKLEEIYNAHSDQELKDLLDLRYKYSENYLKILSDTFQNISITKEEFYRMIFGIEINEADFHKRPFSKFKKDIIDELLRK